MILSPAAVCQCFTLVALCTSIADPNWIHIQNGTEPSDKQFIYGVAYTLHAAQNLTDTAPLGGVNGVGMWLLYALAAACYAAVLLSSSSFLFDFLGFGFTHSRLVLSLHISTAALCLAVLGVSGACLYVIQQNVQKGKLGRVSVPSAQADSFSTSPGESFYIEVLALLFSFFASVFSFCCRPQSLTPSLHSSAEPTHGEREPLIGRMEPGREELGDE